MERSNQDLTNYLRTDFHVHTIFSKDSLTTPTQLIASAKRKGVARVVVSDHNKIEGGLQAKEIDPERIIIGEEIDTTEGEILAIYVSEEIPPGLPPMEVITQLRKQNAFISVSHPFDPTRKGSWRLEALLEIVPYIDAIETFNARCMWPGYNWKAIKFAQEHQLLGTHGSDAHAAFEIGRGSLLVPIFFDAPSLVDSLKHSISPKLTLSMPWVHFTSRYATWVKKWRKPQKT